ncbi:Poly(A) RNA polymerase protein cid1 [Rhypophila decipiens]|uniref:polynucleotide adenylyltransferase n=1 Tax=Rhypophila decipiens TaxID=261697 RepID=A0AAN7B9P6_9PEZI|nr:Poly(A) RNA polymerase protein cid1 [Rhypophila decipiens]
MNPHPPQNEGSGLEDRLRGLILNHPSPDPSVQYPPPPAHENLFPGAPVPQFASQGSNPPKPPPGFEAAPGPALANADSTNKRPRKRMNQAERRQASSQLSIPIGPRAQVPPTPQSAGLYSKSPGQQLQSGAQYEHHGPRSAPFRGNRDTPSPGASAQSHSRNQSFHSYNGPPSSRRTLFDPSSPRNPGHSYNNSGQYQMQPEDVKAQADLLEGLCHSIIANAEITIADIAEKENFRIMIESVARDAICRYEREQNGVLGFPPESVQLRCFGSLSSGFATKDADMDLGLLSPLSRVQPDGPNSPIPRLVEKAFLDLGLGARLLTRTRVPIIKICEKPPSSLLAALLEERAKWDRGLDGNTEKSSPADDLTLERYTDLVLYTKARPPYQRKFPSLRQGKMSLQSYYSFAKALLKRLGGRDLTAGTLGNFTEADYCFINDFSREFVDGLADSELRDRLQRYPSLRLRDSQNHRTLYGVHAQIEGEKLVMVWESRAISEKDDYLERQARRHLTAWQELQYGPEYGRDSLHYNRELTKAVEHLKTIPTIQLSQHSQTQHESAVSYHHRTSRLLADLGGFDTPSPKNQLLPSVVRQYIQGIYLPEIRKQMDEFAESRPGVSLRTVARNHKALQLAHDYEKCLQKGLYPDKAVPLIESYIKVLRTPMTLAQVPGRNFDNFVVSCSDELAGKGPELLRLGNPSKMAPNQPRDPYRDKLEFPKSGVGVQCDINFSAHLGLQNTLLLRCYSHCDPRVRPLVLFVKHWAKVRGINTPYRGSLSSYGYVLMMLHYLVNVVQPFVCPNLQLLAPPPDPNLSAQQIEETVTCKGRNIRFWRDEQAIKGLAQANALTQNRQSVGELLRGFFEYYAHFTAVSSGQGQGFDWGRDVISLRTPGGLLSKQEKGWTGAKTVIEEVISPREPPSSSATEPVQDDAGSGKQEAASTTAAVSTPTTAQPARETKEVRYRYLFAIEDPFELDHNVARTVTHNGIVSIRDEFRRAWRIIKNAGKSGVPQEDLLEDLALAGGVRDKEEFQKLLAELHGSTWNTLYCSPADAQNEVKTGSGAE